MQLTKTTGGFLMRHTAARLLPVILIAGLAGGCDNKILTTAPTDQLSDATFWKTPDDAARAINGVYNWLPGQGWLYDATVYREVLGPNAHSSYPWEGFQAAELQQYDATSRGIISGIWWAAYGGVGRANNVLAHIDEVTTLDAASRATIAGEAKFLRALYYFNIENYYGSGPLFLSPPELGLASLPRATHAEMVAQILKDLDEAAAALPLNAAQPGRATKGAALALKARILLYESRWPEAAAASKAVMDLGKYSLYPDYRRLFLPQNENNQEVIFDVQYSEAAHQTHDYDRRLSMGSPDAEGWASIVPLPNLAADYYMTDGLPASQSPLYDPANPYANRDPRLDQTLFHIGSVFRGKVIGTDFAPNYNYTGLWFKKFTAYDAAPSPAVPGGHSETNLIVLRYGEVLLNYAEAQNEAVGPDASVYAAINAVRARASVAMPPVPAGLSKAQMRDEIRHERRIELAGEGLYFDDIRRWRTAEAAMAAVTWPGSQRAWTARNYLFPVPQHEIDLNGKLSQNQGY